MLSSYTGAGKAQVLLTKNLGGHHQSLSGKKSEVIPMSMCGEIKKADKKQRERDHGCGGLAWRMLRPQPEMREY